MTDENAARFVSWLLAGVFSLFAAAVLIIEVAPGLILHVVEQWRSFRRRLKGDR